MISAQVRSQVFSRQDIQNFLDGLDGANRDLTDELDDDCGVKLYRRGFKAALDAVSTALGVPRQTN